MSNRAHSRAKADWEAFWGDLGLVEPRRALLEAAGDIAARHQLRGYDAVHLASALAIPAGAVVMAVWDTRLSAAAAGAGLSVAPLPG